MENEVINSLTETFEGHAQTTESGVDFWLARDLQFLFGYTKWDNFLNVVMKAKTACEVSGHEVPDHFADIGKMVVLGSGSKREIAFAQTYFALQTLKVELIEKRLLEAERVSARKKLSASEKELSGLIFEQTGGNQDFAPTLILKAKDFATEITIQNAKKHDMRRESETSTEHIAIWQGLSPRLEPPNNESRKALHKGRKEYE